MPDQLALREALQDLVSDVEASPDLRRRLDRRPRRNVVLLAAAAVLVVALVGAVLVAVRDEKPSKVVSTPDTVHEGWRKLAPSPLSSRTDPAAVWTGDRLVVWGGLELDAARDDGAVYDPDTDEWRPMADAPIDGGVEPVAVWTGHELLVWTDHLAAYDPEHDRWRRLPDAPIPPREGAGAVWTGSELVVWGGYVMPAHPGAAPPIERADGAVFDPRTDEWRTMRESPLSGRTGQTMVWTGSEVLLWGGMGMQDDELLYADGAGYDPATDTWNYLPSAPLDVREGVVAGWTGSKLLVWGGYDGGGWARDGATFDPETGAWHGIAASPGETSGGGPATGVLADRRLYTWPDQYVYDLDGDYWSPLPAAPVAGDAELVWTGRDLLVLRIDGTTPLAAYRPPPHAAERTGPTCGTTYDHLTPTYLPEGWSDALEPGAGGGGQGEAVGHWSGGEGQFVDVWPSPGPWPLGAETTAITVLDRPARLGPVHDGFGVETACGFELVGYGITQADLRMLAEGLVDRTVSFALWPEWTPSIAIEHARQLKDGGSAWREDAGETAKRFAEQQLGWHVTSSEPRDGGRVVDVVADEGAATLGLSRNVAGRWWTVHTVSGLGADGSVSITATEEAIDVRVDPGAPYADALARATRGTFSGHAVEHRSPFRIDRLPPLDAPGSILVVFVGDDGVTHQAWGMALPPTPFAAG